MNFYNLESQEFYELMQQYRHADIGDQPRVIEAFDAVKSYLNDMFNKHVIDGVSVKSIREFMSYQNKEIADLNAKLEIAEEALNMVSKSYDTKSARAVDNALERIK